MDDPTMYSFVLPFDAIARAYEDMLRYKRSGVKEELCLQVDTQLVSDGEGGFRAKESSCHIKRVPPGVDPVSEELPAL